MVRAETFSGVVVGVCSLEASSTGSIVEERRDEMGLREGMGVPEPERRRFSLLRLDPASEEGLEPASSRYRTGEEARVGLDLPLERAECGPLGEMASG